MAASAGPELTSDSDQTIGSSSQKCTSDEDQQQPASTNCGPASGQLLDRHYSNGTDKNRQIQTVDVASSGEHDVTCALSDNKPLKQTRANIQQVPTLATTKNHHKESNSPKTSDESSMTDEQQQQAAAANQTSDANRKTPKRKLSVFSHSGFPSLHQLDQQQVRRRSVQLDSAQLAPPRPEKVSSSSSATTSQELTSKSNHRRLARSDTLGSNGSSRASSCDEPVISPLSSSSSTSAISKSEQTSHISGSSNSLDSTSGKSSGKDKLLVPPFESIKTKMKRDSLTKLDSESIQRHIESVISQNDALIDNCNLVSIRSYNSSPSSTLRSTDSSNLRGSNRINGRISKRWSTSTLQASQLQVPGKWSSSAECDNSSGRAQRLAASNLRLEQVERKHSYNLARKSASNAPSSLLASFARATANLQVARPESNKQTIISDSSLQPMQLENAIQNLSLKRKDSEQQQHPQVAYLFHGPSALYVQDHITGQQSRQLENLMLGEQQQQQQLEEQQVAIASLLLERQKHQVQLDNQTDLLSQQLLLEHQLDQLRLSRQLAITLEPLAARDQLESSNLNQQQQPQIAAFPSAIYPLAANHSANYLQQQHQQLLFDQHQLMLTEYLREEQQRRASLANHQLTHHGSELITQSLDRTTPAHRCDICDISFWTRDLLNYHRITQCQAKPQHSHQPPLAYNFVGPNNFSAFDSAACEAQLTKLATPPRISSDLLTTSHLDKDQDEPTAAEAEAETEETTTTANDPMSILKQQLLTRTSIDSAAVGCLPFKKRKISEPNKRWQ